jgi:aryl-alcohol dehydrogenase-like predicted oxidoreductase
LESADTIRETAGECGLIPSAKKSGTRRIQLSGWLFNAQRGKFMDADSASGLFAGIDIGIGTWAWGDRLFWGYGGDYHDTDLREAFDYCIAAGNAFFDTAEVYGQGKSESLLGRYLQESGASAKIATKFAPLPWRLNGRALKRALRGSLKRLKMNKVDLYQIHWPFGSLVSVETWMEAMADLVESDLIGAVGVSNYSREQTQRAYDVLTRHGVHLASNQVEYHLLDRTIEKNGLLDLCNNLGIKVIAYSPIAKGVLSGKYTPQNPLPGFRENRYPRNYLEKIQPLIRLLRKIGMDHGGKTPAQVAINWVICKGAFPIPGVKNLSQAQQNLEAGGWRLTENEIAQLDQASDAVAADIRKV